jgi:broad specificity phosphatase PhoE
VIAVGDGTHGTHETVGGVEEARSALHSSFAVNDSTRLVLVRHARSAHVHRGWVDSRGVRDWRDAYEAAGIHDAERVPETLGQLASRASLIVSSDAARAISTARLLATGREVVISPLLRELDLACPDLGPVRLPLGAWTLLIGGRVLLSALRGRHPSPAEEARLREAAAWLESLADSHDVIVAVTHGSFRQELATRLLRGGWQSDGARRRISHWSAWEFLRHPSRKLA